jgi:hypothetical protein
MKRATPRRERSAPAKAKRKANTAKPEADIDLVLFRLSGIENKIDDLETTIRGEIDALDFQVRRLIAALESDSE